MQLAFLGQSYTASLPPVEVTETAETGIFLGKRYVKKQCSVNQRQQPVTELTYRGNRYSR